MVPSIVLYGCQNPIKTPIVDTIYGASTLVCDSCHFKMVVFIVSYEQIMVTFSDLIKHSQEYVELISKTTLSFFINF